MEQTKSYLKTVPFTDFLLWDVKRYNYIFNSSFENAVFLKNILKPYKLKLSKEELIENDWRIISKINFQGELFLREKDDVKSYKGDLYKVPDNSIIYSKINVRHGCIYYHKKEEEPFGVSSEYPTFTFNQNIVNGKYLMLVLRSNEFKKLLNTKASGISKARVKVDEFLSIKIPLPELSEQNRIVLEYNQKIHLAKQQKKEANSIENKIEDYLYNALKLSKNVAQQKEKGLQFTSLNQTSRWDTLFLKGNMPILQTHYPLKQFRDVITKFNKGSKNESIRINSKDYPNDQFVYIGMENIEKETGNLLNIVKVIGEEIKSQTLKVPQDYFIYGKLRPYLNKYWFNETSYDNIICSSEFFVFNIKTGVNKQFFKYVLSSSFIQQQITDKTSGARMPRINETIFYNLQFPLPEYDKQNEIADHINSLKTQMKILREKANKNKEEAKHNFELEIFNS